MGIAYGGDPIRHGVAEGKFAAAGLPPKAREALLKAGVLSVRELVESPWTDEEAGRRFTALKWRLSVSPYSSAKLLAEVEACRARLLQDRGPQ
jgi:hypothetical protein